MSLGYQYDMVLLPPRAPSDNDSSLQRPRHGRRPGHRSRRARRARRKQISPNSSMRNGDNAPYSSGNPQPATGTTSLTRDLSSMSLAARGVPAARNDAPSTSFAPPPPEELTSSVQGPATASSPFPYGLNNAATAYTSSVSTNLTAYTELPGHHLCSTVDLLTTTPASTYADSSEDSDAWAGADFSGLRDPGSIC